MSARNSVTWDLGNNEYLDETETDTGEESYSDCTTDTDTEEDDSWIDDYVDAGVVGIRFFRVLRQLRQLTFGAH